MTLRVSEIVQGAIGIHGTEEDWKKSPGQKGKVERRNSSSTDSARLERLIQW